jgi:hypothetical protein
MKFTWFYHFNLLIKIIKLIQQTFTDYVHKKNNKFLGRTDLFRDGLSWFNNDLTNPFVID